MLLHKYSIIFIITLNLFSFILTGIDKYKSKHHKWRIKEKTLFTLAALGGSIGILTGMYVFRHKTKHMSFVFGIPTILALQISGIIILLRHRW